MFYARSTVWDGSDGTVRSYFESLNEERIRDRRALLTRATPKVDSYWIKGPIGLCSAFEASKRRLGLIGGLSFVGGMLLLFLAGL